jgi:AraC family transcriptional regulator
MNTYFGTLRRKLQTRNTRVGEWAYPGQLRIERHSHDLPYLSLVLSGQYREMVGSIENEIDGPTAIVHIAGESHRDEFGSRGATIFSVDMPLDWFEAGLGRTRAVCTGLNVNAAINSLVCEMSGNGEGAEWFVESALLHLVGSLVRNRRKRSPAPGWLTNVVEYLQDNYSRKIPLAELAAIAGVHPVHLARHFHKVHGCTVGEYVQSLRVGRALEDLLRSNRSIADIAGVHGFSDQSHLSRLIKLKTGQSPRRWRTKNRFC